MPVLDQLASALGRNDEVPNQELAKQIASGGDSVSVRVLVDNLSNKDKAIQSDCIKVLYEIGGLQPKLIAGYADTFAALLSSRNNRLVWGAMTALGAVVAVDVAAVAKHADRIVTATETGSVITQDWGVRVLAVVARHDPQAAERIIPFLIRFLTDCPAKDVPRHAESMLPMITAENRGMFLRVLEQRRPSLKPAQAKRIAKVAGQIQKL